MRQKRTVLLLVVALAVILSGFTCKHSALQTSTGVAASLKALQNGEIALHDQKQVTDDEHRFLQEGFITIAREDKIVRQCIYDSGAPGCVDAAIATVQNFQDSKVNGIKNPQSKQQIQLLCQSLITALNTLKAAL